MEWIGTDVMLKVDEEGLFAEGLNVKNKQSNCHYV